MGADSPGEVDPLLNVQSKAGPKCLRHGSRFLHHRPRGSAQVRPEGKLVHRQSGQCRHRVEGEITPEFKPEFVTNVGEYWCPQTSLRQHLRQHVGAGAFAAIRLAQAETVTIGMPDNTGRYYL